MMEEYAVKDMEILRSQRGAKRTGRMQIVDEVVNGRHYENGST